MFSTVFSSLFSILRNSQLESNVLPFVVNVTLDLYTNAAKRDEQTKNNGLNGREMFEVLVIVVPSDKKAGFIFGF